MMKTHFYSDFDRDFAGLAPSPPTPVENVTHMFAFTTSSLCVHNISAIKLHLYIFYNFVYGNVTYMFILHSQYPRFACPIILLLTMRLTFSIHTHNDFAVLTCEHVTISCIF